MTRRTWTFAALILAPLLLAAILPAADTDYKIDRNLMKKLTDDEQAVVPFFVVFGDRPDLSRAHTMNDRSGRGRFVVQMLRNTAERSQNGVRGYLRGRKLAFTPFWVENKIYVLRGTLELARTLGQRSDVVAILPEIIYAVPQPQVSSDSGVQSVEWGVSTIRAPEVWSAYSTTGQGLVVANIDTGVQYDHPALVSHYRGKTDTGFNHTGNWYNPTTNCTPGVPCDNNGHGTHTMGTMVGDDGGTNQIGVAPGAKWIACKGCETNSCSGAALTACAQWIMDPLGNGGQSGLPDVVNNSWGGGSGSSWYQSYVQNWRAAGIFPAFSAGNSGPGCGTANSPGDYPESFASGATDNLNVIASFSSRGPSAFGGIKPNLSSPGVNVRSSVPVNSYANYSGTSMASPHTAGAVALLWAAQPGYRNNIAGTQALLQDKAYFLTSSENCGATPPGSSPNNTYGHGLLDVKAAADGGSQPPNQPPTVHITSPLNGQQNPCGAPVSFSATVIDPEGQTLTPTWTDNGGALGSGSPSKTYTCFETGNHNIVAKATDSSQNTGSDSVTITVYDASVPTTPGNFTATVNGRSVILSWTDSKNETSYRLQRKQKSGKTWTIWSTIASGIAAGTTSYTDTNVVSKGQYQYLLFAVNGSKESTPGGPVSARIR